MRRKSLPRARRPRKVHPDGRSFFRGRKPVFEYLEDRRLLAIVTVTNNNDVTNGDTTSIATLIASDGGDGISLREAITAANNTLNVPAATPDEIQFAITPLGGVKTIQPASELPAITDAVVINGYTQMGASPGTFNIEINHTITIELDGQNAGAGADGLQVDNTANGTIIRGLVINRFSGNGVFINGADNVVVAGNFIGTDVAGTTDLGNNTNGVLISGEAVSNVVGGTAPADRNLISSNNSDGVEIAGEGAMLNQVLGNLIGTDRLGTTDLGNTENGVFVTGSTQSTTIGGTGVLMTRNIISGNDGNGILIMGAGTATTLVEGNYIGTNVGGVAALANNSDGVEITDSANNTVGGTAANAGNLISGNGAAGVQIFGPMATGNMVLGNRIGTVFDGSGDIGNVGKGVQIRSGASNNTIGGPLPEAANTIANNDDGITVELDTADRNRIQRNSIFNNDFLGIDLDDNGVTLNDLLPTADADEMGANRLQNFPLLVGNPTLLGNSIGLTYRVDTAPANAMYPLTIEFFVADSNGANPEGRTFLAADQYVAGQAQMNKSIIIPAPAILSNQRLVATATDAEGNTSEFSQPVQIALPTILGSEPTIIRNGEVIGTGEVDLYQYIAHSTGKLHVRIDFLHDVGDLDLEVRDQFGNVLASSATSSSDDSFEEIIIPVVAQQKYFIRVAAIGFMGEQTNTYNLEVENFPAPVPSGVHLDPASDTGMMNNDNVTSDTTPTFFIQTDVLNFVDTNNNGLYNEHDPLPIAPNEDAIDALTAEEANRIAAGMPMANDREGGIAVEITLVNTTDGVTTLVGFADPVVMVSPEVYRFTVGAPLTPGVYLVSARTRVFDGQSDAAGNPAQRSGRSNASPPLWFTISADSPVGGTFDLLDSSDTGMFNNDNVTNKMQPAFSGQGPAGAKVNVFAQSFNAAGMPVGAPLLVGNGVVGSDATDGMPANGLGLWEVTVEPMADGKYNFFARFETAAGVVGDPVAMSMVLTPTAPPPPPVPIPDNMTINSQIIVPAGTMGTVVDVDVRVNIMHTNDEDLDIILIAPDGTMVDLSSDNGNGGANYTNTIFDDAAGTSITAGLPPFTGTFRPEQPLATLNGKAIAGTWTLRIVDDEMNEQMGQLIDWSLTIQTPLMVVIDTIEPNTPLLDLLDDTGRHDNDNITKDTTPMVSMTTTDTTFAHLLFTDNLKFRIYDRFENSAQEVLIYDSALDAVADAFMTAGDMFTAATQLTRTLPVLTPANPAIAGMELANGVHNLKLEVEDRAGNISHDFLLQITVDNVTPPVSFGLPDVASIFDGLTAQSDTGVVTMPMTFADRATSDTTPRMWGRAEADTIVRLYFDRNNNGIVDPMAAILPDIFLGQTVAVPFDGNDAYPDGYWEITTVLDLNEIIGLPKDGLRRLLVTAEDVAGNPMPMNGAINQGVDELQIFIDTQGPQVTNVQITDHLNHDLFDPKPLVNGCTPLVHSLKISVQDLPNRLDQAGGNNDFLYEALKFDAALTSQIDNASNPGNYLLVGDHVGTLPIQSVTVMAPPGTNGNPAFAMIILNFFAPLPDDRYTLTIRDNLVDPVGNKLDGESNANEPQEAPLFPSGDGVPGGNFVARFTIDSRPEIGSYVSQAINLDINGNFVWDPANAQIGNDTTNVDLSFTLPAFENGSAIPGNLSPHELLVAGKFRPIIGENGNDGKNGNGGNGILPQCFFDQLASYGNYDGIFRWLIDLDSDGVVYGNGDPDGFNDIIVNQAAINGFNIAGAIPIAGNFDGNLANGDEIGLYFAGSWAIDTNHNYVIDSVLSGNLLGHPIVGDFDGNGTDDFAVFNNNVFSFGFNLNPNKSAEIIWGFPGVLDRPVAADMDQDGIDDIGLWVPRNSANPPRVIAEWYFRVSNTFNAEVRAANFGTVNLLNHPFSPVPFGADLYAEFGDERALPIVGNFDPPVAAVAPGGGAELPGDYDRNGVVNDADRMVWRAGFGSTTNLAADGNGDGVVNAADYAVWRNNMGKTAAVAAALLVDLGSVSPSASTALVTDVAIQPSATMSEPTSASATAAVDSTRLAAVDGLFATLVQRRPTRHSFRPTQAMPLAGDDDDLLLAQVSLHVARASTGVSVPESVDDELSIEAFDELLTEFEVLDSWLK